jgi:peptidoglycan/xylan/chitin deacetylase (PgdA/CDA1 family)
MSRQVVPVRSTLKSVLGRSARSTTGAVGATLLTYHRVGGGTRDELDLPVDAFRAQADLLCAGDHDVVSLDRALDRLDAGDARPSVVLTFDDGFADVYRNAFPILQERALPFTLYLAAGLVGGEMRWEGSGATSQGSPALTWDEILAMQASGLCTVGNHTWDHAGPQSVDDVQLDRCSHEVERRLGASPAHFAWTWGVPVPSLLPGVRERFRSAATGALGRNLPGDDRHALRRVPVRASDPLPFFTAKLSGSLGPERTYAAMVRAAKAARRAVSRGR